MLVENVSKSRYNALKKDEPYYVDDVEEEDLTDNTSRKKSNVPFEELPLEPLVQYHSSGKKQTPPKEKSYSF